MSKLALGANYRKRILESIFGVFYVMTEGDHPPCGTSRFRFTLLLLVLDGLQVLRSMAVSTFAWTRSSIDIARSVDPVSLFFHTVQKVIPEWVFFGISIVMATGAILNALYVMKLFRAGHVHIIWPLKVLRLLVASIVTIFFSTVLEFLLYPVRCIDVKDEDTFSAAFHGDVRECNPWHGPEMSISIPTVVVAAIFIAFSIVTTFLDFTINPLCMHPLSQCTGRLEALWTLFKVAAILLAYLSPFISPTACAIMLFLLSLLIFAYHIAVLPFHHEPVNVMRGGIYLATVMFCLANIIVLHYPDQQALQHWMLAAVVVAFVAGRFTSAQVIAAVNRYLGVLRGQWDEKAKAEKLGRHGQRERRASMMSEAAQIGTTVQERSLHQHFFDPKWRGERRFSSGSVAYLAARVLLQRRDEDDAFFLMSLLTQTLRDHPTSQNLSIFHLLVLRYVHKERNQSSAQEKISKMQSGTVALDHCYVLFTLNRKAVQENVSQTLGKGSISAVNLMEFDQRMDVARKCHRECIVNMKAFWKHVAKKKHSRSQNNRDQATKMTEELDKFTKAKDQAIQEYAWLHEKYPSSGTLLSSYANFCDHVLNDNKKADQLRNEVCVMEAYRHDDDDVMEEAGDDANALDDKDNGGDAKGTGNNGGGGEKDYRSESSGSQSESHRSQVSRNTMSWNHLIMSRDAGLLTTLHSQVKWALFFLLTLSIVSFAVTDFVLFNDVALQTVRNIEDTGTFRVLSATAPYLLRSQMIQSTMANSDAYLAIQTELIAVTRSMQMEHFQTFEEITSQKIQDFYDDPTIKVHIPRPMGWEHALQSFRHLGTDFARRVASAASATFEEHNNPDFTLKNISAEKRDIAYVFENMIRYLMPAFDEAVGIYESNMKGFGTLTRILTSAGAAVTGVIVIAIGVLVLRGRAAVLQRLHANRVSINLALELPKQVTVRFYKFFSDIETDMAVMEDEELDLKRMEALETEPSRRSSDGRRLSLTAAGIRLPSMNNSEPDSTHNPRSKSVPRSFGRDSSFAESVDFQTLQPAHDLRGALGEEHLEIPKLTADNLQNLIQHMDDPERGSEEESAHADERGGRWEITMDDERHEEEEEEEEESGCEDEHEEEEEREQRMKEEEEEERVHVDECQTTQESQNRNKNKNKSGASSGGTLSPPGVNPKNKKASPIPPIAFSSRSKPPPISDHDDEREEVQLVMEPVRTPSKPEHKTILRRDSAVSESDVVPPLDASRTESDEKQIRFQCGDMNDHEEEEEEGSRPSRIGSIFSLMKMGGKDAPTDKEIRKGKRAARTTFELEGPQEEEEEEGAGAEKVKVSNHALDKQAITEEMQDALIALHFKSQPWFNSFLVYAAALVVVLVLCMLYSLFPARRIPVIINMAPTTNYATERISLARGCIFLARELVLDDGLARMTKAEVSGTLDALLQQYEAADRAVRLGSKEHDIHFGADHRSNEHNAVMYQLGCPWRDVDGSRRAGGSDDKWEAQQSYEECILPADTYPRAAADGLFNLQSVFLDSTKAVLRKYGSPPEEYVNIYFKHREEDEDMSQWTSIEPNPEAYAVVNDDPDLKFLDLMFEGDLYDGLQYIVELFERETNTLLDDVHRETRVLFVVYITFLLVVFYWLLFRSTLEAAREEVVKAQEFVYTVPLHILEHDEANTVKAFYMRDTNNAGEPDLFDDA